MSKPLTQWVSRNGQRQDWRQRRARAGEDRRSWTDEQQGEPRNDRQDNFRPFEFARQATSDCQLRGHLQEAAMGIVAAILKAVDNDRRYRAGSRRSATKPRISRVFGLPEPNITDIIGRWA